ncbi:hypothetical protein ACH5RR_031923 [Cinchona calisaya]|uniref:Uncharacterized protein n=1 Tax=Cinchona calisaya TaxID=153742 RepID=A0ABD2YGM6_9GENT
MDSSRREVEKAVDDTLRKSKADVTDTMVDDDFSPLSGKPHFHSLVTKSHVKPMYRMVFPVKLHKDLPSETVPAVIACRGKTWDAVL